MNLRDIILKHYLQTKYSLIYKAFSMYFRVGCVGTNGRVELTREVDIIVFVYICMGLPLQKHYLQFSQAKIYSIPVLLIIKKPITISDVW